MKTLINQWKMCALLLAMVALSVSLVACGDDEPGEYLQSWLTGEYKTYEDDGHHNQLYLTYNGEELSEKSVYFELPANSKVAKLTFSNIINGEKKTTIENIALKDAGEEGLSFEGIHQTKRGAVRYSGLINMGELHLDLNDVTE